MQTQTHTNPASIPIGTANWKTMKVGEFFYVAVGDGTAKAAHLNRMSKRLKSTRRFEATADRPVGMMKVERVK